MIIAIPLFGKRVAPNFRFADLIQISEIVDASTVHTKIMRTTNYVSSERLRLLEDLGVNVLLCGGIEKTLRGELEAKGVAVRNNLAGNAQEVLKNWREEHPFIENTKGPQQQPPEPQSVPSSATKVNNTHSAAALQSKEVPFDCANCEEKTCLQGLRCPNCPEALSLDQAEAEIKQCIEAAWDISMEPERILCRIAEVVYYCQSMGYRHIGIAFCSDLFAESKTVVEVFRRYFQITSICCKVGSIVEKDDRLGESQETQLCNPTVVSSILNKAKTDINVLLGLCVGCDIVVTKLAKAPTTVLFVKDKLLANNPVGAIYSQYQKEHLLSKI